jgi:uncharacterized membrane protein YpjA
MQSRGLLALLVAVNLAGFLFGICYYWLQLSVTPAWMWVFVIDCPLYVLLFAAIAWGFRSSRHVPRMLIYLTSIGLIKYGLWTGIVVWLHQSHFFSAAPLLYAALFPLHIGMVLEGIALLPWFKAKAAEMVPVLAWFLLNDYMDYVVGTAPMIPQTHMGLLMKESILATLILAVGLYLINRYESKGLGVVGDALARPG